MSPHGDALGRTAGHPLQGEGNREAVEGALVRIDGGTARRGRRLKRGGGEGGPWHWGQRRRFARPQGELLTDAPPLQLAWLAALPSASLAANQFRAG